MWKISVCLLLIAASIAPSDGLKCLDEDEREVDWWIFYKTPKLSKGSVGGDIYVYVTSRTLLLEQSWIYSPKPITTNDSMIATTLNQVYLNSKMFNYVQYNDELPSSVKSKVTGGYRLHLKLVGTF